MSIQIYPNLTASSSGPNAYSVTVPTAKYRYKVLQSLSTGVYTITTSPTNTEAYIQFITNTSTIVETVTVGGTVTLPLSTAATGFYIRTMSGSNTVVTITLTASSLSESLLSGTLDTITTSGTYNQTGWLYVVAIGGGGGGGGNYGYNNTGQGGGAGQYASKIVYANGTTTVTLGAGGNNNGINLPGNAGGTTNFGNLLSAGGGSGGQTSGGNNNSEPGGANSINDPLVINGSNGGGGNGTGIYGASPGPGGGSGIGTGGGGSSDVGADGTGYGAGGGGTGRTPNGGRGGNGTQGIVYVLRGF